MCQVLQVTRSGYYAWVARAPSAQRLRQEDLLGQIRRAHEISDGTYGSPRIHAELAEQEIEVCVNTVAKLMKKAGIRSIMHRRFVVRTTDSNHDLPVASNVLERKFHADLPNQKWCCDITYIPTAEGFLYLAGVMDAFSRKLIAWAMGKEHDATLVKTALQMALVQRDPGAGLIHHSDRGSEYASQS